MKGKFSSPRDQVVYRAASDDPADTFGSDQFRGVFYKLIDFYGYDWIVFESPDGFVDVERFDHIDIDDDGYFTPVERAWDAARSFHDSDDGDDV